MQYKDVLTAICLQSISVDTTQGTIVVYTGYRLCHRETGLPTSWEQYNIVVMHKPHDGQQRDYTDQIGELLATAKNARDDTGVVNDFIQHYQDVLKTLAGFISIRLARFENNTLSLILLVCDWESASVLESLLQSEYSKVYPMMSCPQGAGIYQGIAVSVLRDGYDTCLAGEEYLDDILVGSRVGEGGMTAGALLKDQNGSILMLQCSHGYKAIGIF